MFVLNVLTYVISQCPHTETIIVQSKINLTSLELLETISILLSIETYLHTHIHAYVSVCICMNAVD